MPTRAPDEGPSTGGPFASSVDGQFTTVTNVAAEELYNPRILCAVAKKYNIDSTKSLVVAYNKATAKDERAVLLKWLRNYEKRKKECLSHESVLEYAELARIKPRSIQDKDVLKSLVFSLRTCIREGEFLENNVAAALYKALVHVDPVVYGGVAELLMVAKKLLSSLSPEPRLTHDNFAQYEATFIALRQTLFLLLKTNQNGVYAKEKHELRRAIAEKEKTMELSCNYYPVSFHLKTLRQAVEHLRTVDSSSFVTHAMQFIGCGLCGFLHVFHFARNLARCDIDPAAVQDTYRKAQVAIANMGVLKRPWFDSFRNLMLTRQEASEDEMKFGNFENNCNVAMEHQRNMKNGEDLKALRYGIVRELGILALEGLSEDARIAATTKLVDLATQQAISEGWSGDIDILVTLMEVICELHGKGQLNEDIENALLVLHQSCEGLAQGALTEWLGGSSVEDKLAPRCPRKPDVEYKDLCNKAGKDVGYIPLAILHLTREKLRKKYLHDEFTTVLPQKHIQVDESALFCR